MTTRAADRAFAKNLRAIRQAAGMTQQQLADGISICHHTAITKIEAGNRTVSIGEAMQLADALGVSLVSLIECDLPAAAEAGDKRRAIEHQVRREVAAKIARMADKIAGGEL